MSMTDLEDSLIVPDDLEDDNTIEDLLERLSLEVIRRNIIGQVEGDISPNRDFLSIILSKYRIMVDTIEDEDILRQLRWEFNDFVNSTIDEIVKHYNLFLDLPEEDSDENTDVLLALYTFFVTMHKSYAITYLINYIISNKQSIVDTMGLNMKGTDVTSQAYKRKGLDKYSVAILANIDEVIDYVTDIATVGVVEFLDIIDDGDFYVNEIRRYTEDNIIIGNFIEMYLDEIIDERCSESALRVRNDIRVRLMEGI